MEYNIHSGVIRWQISNSTTFTMAAFNGQYGTYYLMIIVMCALSITTYEIYTNQIKLTTDLKLKVEVKNEKKRDCTIQLAMFDSKHILVNEFFQNFSYLPTCLCKFGHSLPHTNTRMHAHMLARTHAHTNTERVCGYGYKIEICKCVAYFPKNVNSYPSGVSVRFEDYVFRFDVSVDDAAGMQVLNRRCDVVHY